MSESTLVKDVGELLASPLLSSPVIHILVTFLLTSIVGAKFAQRYQQRNWQHQKKISDQDAERRAAEVAFHEISKLMDKRLYRMRQLLWALNRNDKGRIKDKMSEYSVILYEWNDNNNINLARIEQYFGTNERKFFEGRISRDFIFIGMLLENWYFGNEKHPSFREMFEKIDSLNAHVYSFDKRLLAAIQAGKVGLFREDFIDE